MKRPRSLSLGAKLNLSLLAFLLLLAVATSAIITYGFSRTRDNADARSNDALEQGGSLALQAVAGGAAEQGGLLFEAVAEIGQRASSYAGTRAQDDGRGVPTTLEFATSVTGHRYDASPERHADLVVINGASIDDPTIQDDIAFSSVLDTIAPVLLQGFAGEIGGRNLDPIAIVFISPNGVTRHYPPVGLHDRLPDDTDFSERLAGLGPEANPERRSIWSAPYMDTAGNGLIVTARSPVYDGQSFRGAIEVDVSMSKVFAQINSIRPTPRAFAFYVDRDGKLLEGRSFPLLNNEALNNPELAQVLDAMRSLSPDDSTTTNARLKLAGEDYYIAYNTVGVLGGTFAVGAPVSDITAAAASIGSGIDDEGTRTLQVMLAAMAVLFILGLAGAAFLNRNAVVKPINSLVSAARAVGAGDLTARVPVADAGDELTELGAAFNVMVEQLRESERNLEQRVEDRTRELNALLEVSRSVAATVELAPLLDVILDQLRSLIDYEGGAVVLQEGGDLVQVALRRPPFAPMPPPGAEPLARPLTASTIIWASLSRGEPVVIDDVHDDSNLAVAYRNLYGGDLHDSQVDWIRAWAAIPLTTRDKTIGCLAFAHRTVGHFTEDNLKLGRAVVDQVAVAIENAHLFEHTQRQARDMEALLRADAELFGSLELDSVLQSLVDVAIDVLGVDKSLVTLWDRARNTAEVRAARNFAPESLAIFAEMLPTPQRGTLRDDVLPNVYQRSDPALPAAARSIVDRENIQSSMDIPIRSRTGEVIGGYGVAYTTGHDFSESEQRVLFQLADRAAVAIRNAHLMDETQRHAQETEALLRADAELFGSLELDSVLQALADVAVDVLGADKSAVLLHEGNIDQIRAARNFSDQMTAKANALFATMPHEEPDGTTQRPQTYEDIHDAPAFISERLIAEGVASHVTLPIRLGSRMLGSFGVSFVERHVFADDGQPLFMALADRAAVAIRNAELHDKAQQAASLEERQRLARELHDSVSQALYGIALGTRTARLRLGDDPNNAAEPIDYVMSLAQAGLAEMRALIFELRPESLELEGIVAAIEKQAASTQARYKLDVETVLGDEPACPLEVKEALYRIAQEALHNVVKHAQAQHVEVRLEREGADLVLSVRDDGRGFDASGSFPGHVGLHSMPERAAKLGGTVVIESTPGTGTRVEARVPV